MDAEAHELIAAYALDTLEPADVARAEELLRTSAEAREELRALSDAVEGLAVATTGPTPRPELRDQILAAAREETQNVVPLASRRRRLPVALGAVAAVAAAVAIGLGLYAISLSSELDDTKSALEQQQSAAGVLADPSSRTVALQVGEGKLVVSPAGDAVLVVDDLAPAPSGKTYQVWVVEKGAAPASAGLFPGSGGQGVVPVAGTVPQDAVVAVTVERAGGVEQPTSDPVVASQPA
jgi:anti-sigma-K factor RskA